jgi:hypothetical protein
MIIFPKLPKNLNVPPNDKNTHYKIINFFFFKKNMSLKKIF